jgi:hypothetical protein
VRRKTPPPEQTTDVPEFPLPTPEQVAGARDELHAMLNGAKFNESFWQGLMDPSRTLMYAAVRARNTHINEAVLRARELASAAMTVEEKRAARKAAQRVDKMRGALRHTKALNLPDPIGQAWQHSVAWISDARDAAVYLARVNAALERLLRPTNSPE